MISSSEGDPTFEGVAVPVRIAGIAGTEVLPFTVCDWLASAVDAPGALGRAGRLCGADSLVTCIPLVPCVALTNVAAAGVLHALPLLTGHRARVGASGTAGGLSWWGGAGRGCVTCQALVSRIAHAHVGVRVEHLQTFARLILQQLPSTTGNTDLHSVVFQAVAYKKADPRP